MSYQTWHDYGFGFCSDEIETTAEKIENLIALAPNFEANIKEYFELAEISNPTLEDYMDLDQDYMDKLAYILYEVILEAEKIELLHVKDYDGDTYLIYPPKYAWSLPITEKDITKEKLCEIFDKYLKILTDEKIEYDYQSVENGG